LTSWVGNWGRLVPGELGQKKKKAQMLWEVVIIKSAKTDQQDEGRKWWGPLTGHLTAIP